MRKLIALALMLAFVAPALSPLALGEEPPGLKPPKPDPPPPPPSEPGTPGGPTDPTDPEPGPMTPVDPEEVEPPPREEPEDPPGLTEEQRRQAYDLIMDLYWDGIITYEEAAMLVGVLLE